MFLNSHTYYSLRYGTIAPKRLVALAKSQGLDRVLVTDINSTTACMDVLRLARKEGLAAVFGVDFRNSADQQFIVIAKNDAGFAEINTYLSQFLQQSKIDIPPRAPKLAHTVVIYPFRKYRQLFFALQPHEYIGITKEELGSLPFSAWKHNWSQFVVLQTVTFEDKRGWNTHRLLRAIDENSLLSKLETAAQGSPNDSFIPVETLKKAFENYPEIVANTMQLLGGCSSSMEVSSEVVRNQKSYTTSEDLDYRLLKKLANDGLAYRYRVVTPEIAARIKKELEIIKEKGFVSYFLINWKILKYARSKGYFYVGRGSGANSVIAYLLRITDVDPIELDLYFERFINLYRKNPPDFDIDFSWTDRDDITRYIFERFPHTALISVYNTFKYRAAIRELGKVFGLPKAEIDKLSQGQYQYEQLDQFSKLVVKYSEYIQGFPNYLGIHAGGILISEQPITNYTATFIPPKGYATTQFDMVVAEDIGLHKFDILSQRGLGKIKDAVIIATQNNPEHPPIDIHDIAGFKKDERIKLLLKNAKAIGCFYVESPAMRMLLKKLQVTDYLGLVAASSVIRPGVAKSGMMRAYILRYRYPEKRGEAHPILRDIMPDTYGVMVYQEDVIKVAHYFGGLTLGEADMLRRGMSGKFRSREEFLKVKKQFFTNCINSGKAKALVEDVWRQIESFAGYAFAKGHSASYAVESYQSLYLKAYYPLEYMVATINNYGGFYSTELYVHEARMHGARIHPPCINKSGEQTVIYGKDIYMGFMFLQSLERRTIQRILTERKENGCFKSLDDFVERVRISVEQISILLKVDAFAFTGINKRKLLWEAHMKVTKQPVEETGVNLFRTAPLSYQTPSFSSSALEDAFDQIELLGFPLCSPFDLLINAGEKFGLNARELQFHIGKNIAIEGYLVTVKKTRTSNGKTMFFGTFLDREGHFIDSVHFPPIAAQYPFRGKGIYRLRGKVIEEFDCISIEITHMERMAIIEDPRYADSRKAQRPRPKKILTNE
ncbi:DNA-directed DNA polymerase [Tenacibaculum litopenaei]|uniref:DNA polymerase III subunit alpha n=1 Tax=Tenacibaculum litopenaei TaxID=396016 RepID=UPI00389499DC